MKISLIKKALENDKSFQYWNKGIGLSFDDFSIGRFIKDKKFMEIIKHGKKDIGNYYIYLNEDNTMNSVSYDMNSEIVRQHTLKIIGRE
ncbi:hypothetical protein ACOL3B_08765 [Aliarcobacter butzleri]|uniref:hypothetical protein n=1 Tax=Aliarcobacter butzleri TaxID=28197 RepID=UPI002B24F690|nr:hypothetical protein [Aliarcobacter butzleri]